MSDISSILHPVAISQVMINFAASLGVDQETCLLGTGISADTLQDGEALITRAQEMRLVENLMLALPDEPALGFRLGLQYNVSTFGIWGFALRTCRTLREAAMMAMRYLPLSTAYCRMYAFEEDEYFGIAVDPEPIPRHLRQFLMERDIATGTNLMKELSLAGLSLNKVEFQGDPPEHADAIASVCGIPPVYGRPRNAMMVLREEVDKPLPTYNAQLVHMLDDQCRQQLQQRQTAGLAGQVRQKILGELGLVATLDEVASAMAMSSRTLRRKLDQEGVSFRGMIEEERCQLAKNLLANSDMKLEEMAIHLGYTDTASFTRAFKRWMHCSPGEYRKQQLR